MKISRAEIYANSRREGIEIVKEFNFIEARVIVFDRAILPIHAEFGVTRTTHSFGYISLFTCPDAQYTVFETRYCNDIVVETMPLYCYGKTFIE